MNKLLIIGASGLVGKALVEVLRNDYDIFCTYHNRKVDVPVHKKFRLDIDNLDSIKYILKEVKPLNVISCLSGNFESQLKLHIEVAKYLEKTNGRLYFCSSANVFDRQVSNVHYESDKIDAESDYGKFKATCESEISLILKDKLCIIRLPAIWGRESPRLKNILKLLRSKENIPVYDKFYMTSNTDSMIAKQIHYIMDNEIYGVYHLATTDVITEEEFLKKLTFKMGVKNVNFERKKLTQENYYLAIISQRNELPNNLKITNQEVINYLI